MKAVVEPPTAAERPLAGALNDGTAVPLALIIVAAAGLAGTLLLLARKSLRTV